MHTRKVTKADLFGVVLNIVPVPAVILSDAGQTVVVVDRATIPDHEVCAAVN